jgi:dipeptide/tripeptide permease
MEKNMRFYDFVSGIIGVADKKGLDTLDMIIYAFIVVLVFAFGFIVYSYAKGLKGSPREIYLLFFTKVTEYSAYGAINISFVLYLSKDMGLSDVGAGTFMGAYSTMLTFFVIMVGPFCDSIGIKKTLLVGAYTLLFSRFIMPFAGNLPLAVIFGFFPMAIGIAITGPVLSVGIKRFTTKETAALGFGLFYTLMNVGWAVGAWIFDAVRRWLGEHEIYDIVEQAGLDLPFSINLSTYQVIIFIGAMINVPDLIAILFMRDGVEVNDEGKITISPQLIKDKGRNFIDTFLKTFTSTAKKTWRQLISLFKEKPFWIFLFMLFVTVFVRLTFQHFHYTWPKYGIRIFGEGAPIGSIYGVLNPTMIIFLVPLVAALTKRVGSYKMMVFGTFISALSVFVAVIPYEKFAFLVDTWVGELVFVRWLDLPESGRSPLYLVLISFVILFTIGEAFWSPRLMQFTAEIAPEGKEASYLSLAVLPFFFAKFFVGPLSGWLVSTYTPPGLPAGVENYPDHFLVWAWIGSIALLTPIGLLIFKKMFRAAEK